MSDAELRAALAQYGYQNIPITNTTRNILKKKIQFGNMTENHIKKMDHSLSEPRSSKDECSSDKDKGKHQRVNRRDLSATDGKQASTSRAFHKTTICEKVLKTVERVSTTSDAELRTALAQCGYENMPITITTRSTLMKKMKTLMIKNKPQTISVDYSDYDSEQCNEESSRKIGGKLEVIEGDSEMSTDCFEDYSSSSSSSSSSCQSYESDVNMTSDRESNYTSGSEYTSDSE